MKKTFFSLLFISALAQSAEHEIKMLSWGNGEPMVFIPAVLKIEAGDTVTFIPSQAGHQVDSVIIPEGAEKMHSELDEKYRIKLDKQGIYFYTCLPHRMMNMSGLIQIGAPNNRSAVKKAIEELESTAVMNKGRMLKYLKQLDDISDEKSAQAEKSNDAQSSTLEKAHNQEHTNKPDVHNHDMNKAAEKVIKTTNNEKTKNVEVGVKSDSESKQEKDILSEKDQPACDGKKPK